MDEMADAIEELMNNGKNVDGIDHEYNSDIGIKNLNVLKKKLFDTEI
jgi:hypothetical protein